MAAHSGQSDTPTVRSPPPIADSRTFTWLPHDGRPLDWNGPANRLFSRVQPRDLERPIVEHIERIARRHRNRVAIRDGKSALTFGELWDAISGLAATLEAETEPGDAVGILLPACPLLPIAMLASLAAGRPFIAFDPRSPSSSLELSLQDARPTVVVTQQTDVPGIGATRVIRLTGVPAPARDGWRPAPMNVDQAACVLFTSGSTGRPKGIVNSQRSLLQRAAQSINAAHIGPADTLLTLAPPSTIVSVRDVITALVAGASIRLLDPQGAGAREIVHVIREEKVTILFAFPALVRSVAAAGDNRTAPSLRLVRMGGDTAVWSDVDTLRAWLAPGARIQVVYAATEAPMMQWFVDAACRGEDARVPIGFPLPGNRLAIVDDEDRPTPIGGIGELIVGGPYVSLGCWVEGHLVDRGVESGDRSGWRIFRTGDLVRRRSDGLLERVGRKDRQVKIRGHRVDLEGVEGWLRGHPAVQDVAVVARPDSGDGAVTLSAFVSANPGAPATLIDELKVLLRDAPPIVRPARFYPAPAIPRLPNSKLDVRMLAALDERHAQRERGEAAAPTDFDPLAGDRVSHAVAAAWEQVLHVPVRTGGDDFFDSGGDSLTAISFVLELERALGVAIPLALINEAPTFERLCRALRTGHACGSTPLVTLKPGDDRPPVFFIHGLGGHVVTLLPAARCMTYPGPVIGIRARGVVPGESPHASVEAMAADYLTAIKERQPHGPYYLCGYSSGGLVAFELARRLSDAGDEVGLVGLFDTPVSTLRRPLRAWVSMLRPSATRIRGWVSVLTAAPISVTARTLIASARYRPGFYRGQVTLFSPATRDRGLPPLDVAWRDHAGSIVVIETAGTHASMLSAPHAESAAAGLTRCL